MSIKILVATATLLLAMTASAGPYDLNGVDTYNDNAYEELQQRVRQLEQIQEDNHMRQQLNRMNPNMQQLPMSTDSWGPGLCEPGQLCM